MEFENRYASRGVGGTALGLSIGAIGLMALGGGLGNILGLNRSNGGDCSAAITAALMSSMNARECHGDHYVTGREASLAKEIADRDSRIGLLESNIYTDQKIADVYERLNVKIGVLEAQSAQQAVYNATLNGTLSCLQGQVLQLQSLTKTVIPSENICPAPTAAAPATGA